MTETDLEGSVVLLTGGTSGVGREATRLLAARGATVGIVGRNRERGAQVANEVSVETAGTVEFFPVDLSTETAVRSLATAVSERYDRLDVLVHNAAVSMRRRTETPDGIEMTLAVNHLAPYLMTHELLDLLQSSAPSRIVVTGSEAHRRTSLDLDDLQRERRYDALEAYARSKLANVAFTIELATRLDERVTANCVHPGFIPSTGILRDSSPWKRSFLRLVGVVPGIGTTVQDGARRLVHVATSPTFHDRNGCYVGENGVKPPLPEAADRTTRERLWNASAELVDVDPDWP